MIALRQAAAGPDGYPVMGFAVSSPDFIRAARLLSTHNGQRGTRKAVDGW